MNLKCSIEDGTCKTFPPSLIGEIKSPSNSADASYFQPIPFSSHKSKAPNLDNRVSSFSNFLSSNSSSLSNSTMTVEAALTRELEIRFIDARALCNEAKLGLKVDGYPSAEQEVLLVEEAKTIFRARPEDTQRAMIKLKSDLDAVKIPNGSMSSRTWSPSCDGTEEDSSFLSSDVSISSKTSSSSRSPLSSRKFKLWPLRRNQVAKSGRGMACLVAPPQA